MVPPDPSRQTAQPTGGRRSRIASPGQIPFGCQTVLVSRTWVSRSSPGSTVQSSGPTSGRRTRLRVSAAASSTLVASVGSVTPVRSSPLTSACEASQGATSATYPVRMFTTPPGRSLVANTSAQVIAGSGSVSEASTTTVLPLTITGATTLTNPNSGAPGGATIPTTPVGSGEDRLK